MGRADGRTARNLIILALVLGLLAASAIVIATKPTVLGLDLRGGTELVYQARPTPQSPRSRPRRSTARSRSSASAPTRSASPSPRSRGSARTEIQVGLPNVQNAAAGDQADRDDRAALLLRLRGATSSRRRTERPEGSRRRPRTRTPTSTPSPTSTTRSSSPRSESRSASTTSARRTGPPTTCSTASPTSSLAGPAEKQKDLFLNFPNGKQPPGTDDPLGPAGDGRRPGGVAATRHALPEPERDLATPAVRASRTARRSPATTSPTRSRTSTRRPTSRTSPSTSPTQGGRRSRT